MQHRFLEDEEEFFARKVEWPPSEEWGLEPISSGISRAVALAGAALSIAPKTESPIEATLGARLKLLVDGWNETTSPKLLLVAQYPLLQFRYDFAIGVKGKLLLAIECDGKEFHSSDQARANDAAKDAAIRAKGAEIFRFTGSQIFRGDVDCVIDVERYLIRTLKDIR